MNETRAYSTRQFLTAIMLSAVLGWAGLVVTLFILEAPRSFTLSWVTPNILLGLPVAIVFACVVLGPILWWAMKTPLGWLRSTGIGAICVSLPLLLFVGAISTQTQPYLLELAIASAAYGAFIALLVRAIIGPGRAQT